MRRLFTTLAICSFLSLRLLATGDSLNYLTPKDTIFLKTDEYGTLFFEHELERGQTLYSLSRFYGLKLDALYEFNSALDPEMPVPPGVRLKIPMPDSAIVKAAKEARPLKKFVPVCYVVKHGDTFFSIAKSAGVHLDTLKNRNKLTSTMMKTGQIILTGWLSTEGIPEALQTTPLSPFALKMRGMQQRYDLKKKAKKPQFHNGAAYWQREKKGGKDDFYALHRNAEIGSVLQIKNPMKHKTVYAKVIGRIPDRAYGDDTIVVLSPSVAKLLGAKDPRFFVEIKYFEK